MTMEEKDKCWIESPISYWDEEEIDVNPCKRLLYLTKQYDFEKAIQCLRNFASYETKPHLLPDEFLKTAAHYAAMHQDGEAALTEIVKKVDSDCLTTPDEDKITPLHLSARYHSDKSWQQNFELTQRTNNELRFSLSRFKDSNGDTCAHWAARNAQNPKMVLTVREKSSSVCWNWKNSRNETVLHYALQYCSQMSSLTEILKQRDIESYMFAEEDVDGNTAAHFAARNENSGYRHFRKISKMRTDSSANHWLKCMNKKDETVLHLAALHGSPSLASKLIQLASENPKTLREWYELKDKQGNTFLHALARSEGKDSVLLEALNLKAASPNQKQPKRQELIASLEQNMPENAPQPQENQENQAKAQHEKSRSVASTASQGRQPDNSDVSRVLLCQNKRKSTVLHYAVENCERETIEKLLKAMKTLAGILICCDKAGNTVFHIAAKRTDKTEVLKLLLKSLRLTTVEQVAPIMRKRNNKNRSVFHFAIDAMDPSDSDDSTPNDPPLSQEDQLSQEWTIKRLITSKAISKEELQRTDRAGNTLLHSLMQSQLTYDGFEQDILDRFKLLVKNKVKKTAHNNLNLNCLHATKLDPSVLHKLLSKEEAATLFEDLLVNSATGAHIIHTFSGQYDLIPKSKQTRSGLDGQTMLDVIEKVSNKGKAKESSTEIEKEPKIDILIKKRVNPPSCENAEHGETCLHFACAYGHQENIAFLLQKGLKIWCESHSGQTCVDYAFDNGNLDEFILAVRKYNRNPNLYTREKDTQSSGSGSPQLTNNKEIKMTDIWRLLDPPKRALKLPDRQAARTTLVTITNDYETTRNQQEKKKQKTDRMVLIRSLEMDSRRIFRAALSLDIVTRETEPDFTEYFIATLRIDGNIRRAFQQQNIFKHMDHVDDTFELALLDLAAFFHRDEILPDLILTRQFELIPCCLSLLIRLGPEIIKMRAKAEGKHEQLLQLQKKVTNIAVNALNELFENADRTELELLNKYIKGEITNCYSSHDRSDAKVSNDYHGPKFPYRVWKQSGGKVKYKSVFELVKKADTPDLFATDCIYALTNEQWRNPISSCSVEDGYSQNCEAGSCCLQLCGSRCRPKWSLPTSPRAKFWSHTAAFALFLGFFGWYVLDFQISYKTPEVDALLVAYLLSFCLQEWVEFWRQRSAKENCKIGKHVRRLRAYFVDWLNIFDLLAIFFLSAGLIARWFYFGWGFKVEDAYPSQMLLSTSFALFCFRSVSFLSYFEGIGPMISMLWNLIIFDLLPFLMILFVIFGCFGVFFTCLLFSFAWAPEAHDGNPYYRWQVFIQAATLPFNLLFNNFDQLEFSSSPDSTTLGKVAIKQGHEWFYYLLIFIFLGLVNVVMMNMLIALFNLRVTQMYGVAIGIWRKRSFEMLQEYQEMSLFPPPFSFLVYFFFNFPTFVYSKCCNRKKNKVIADSNSNNGSGNMNEDDMNDKTKRWWLDKKSYPADYTRFLAFQATQFRRCRSRLLRDTQWNRNDFDVVKAHTGNELADFKLEVQEMLDNLKQHGKHEHESAHKSADKSDDLENLKQRIDDIDKKLEQLLALVRPDRAVEVRGQLSPPTMDSGQQQ